MEFTGHVAIKFIQFRVIQFEMCVQDGATHIYYKIWL